MRIVLIEDSGTDQLAPVALLRPVFELICGRESLRRRLHRWFPGAELGAWIRPWMVDAYADENPNIHVNDSTWIQQGPLLLVNGRWLPERRLTQEDFAHHQAGFVNGIPVWMLISGQDLAELLQGDLQSSLAQFAKSQRTISAGGQLIQYPWDLVSQNATQLVRDFEDEGVSERPALDHVQILGNSTDVYISQQATIDPYVVIDTRTGPVSIDRDVRIQSFTRIEGPCHIGCGTQVFRALIREGTTIGEQCRVGGEVEESILHGYVNKYHEGFLGHSYVCPWVNIGAMTSMSDLKNDYSTVRVPLQGHPIETGLRKVGSFIGDHSKTALDSMFNTGSSIGIMTTVLPGGRLLPRHVPSFCSVVFGELRGDASLDASIETARAVMLRRGRQLSGPAEHLLRIMHQRTELERQSAFQRVEQSQGTSPIPRDVRATS
jgi:UDP-N-acetylglucosamine diphosphorylase/glucosamine-1-phosphate N-acetyltransferase